MTNRLLPLLLLLALLPSLGRADVSATSPPIRHGTAASAPSAPLWTPYYASDTNRWYMVTPSGPSLVLGGVGPTGATGAAGTNGMNGAAGSPGSVWYNGSGVPSSGVGVNGDYDLDTATGNVYQKAAGAWGIVANIKGATGAAGATGATGSAGAAGSTGAAGTNGTNGSNGVGYTLGSASQTAHMNGGATAFTTDFGLLNNGAQLSVGGALDTATSFTMYAPSTSGTALNLKALSGQTGNLLTFSSSTGTGDLGFVDKSGNINAKNYAALTSNTFAGLNAGYSNTTGGNNTFAGLSAGFYNTTGAFNTFAGTNAGYHNTTGGNNTFAGMSAGSYNTTGGNNTFAGMNAGYGTSGATANTTGSNNTYLGMYTSLTGSTQYSNSIALGFRAQIGASNACIIGGAGANAVSVGIGGITAPAAQLHVVNSSPSQPVIRADMVSGQTANAFEIRDNTLSVKLSVAANGAITAPVVQTAIATKTASYTLTANDTTVLLNGTTLTATLPTNDTTLAGHTWTIKEIAASSGTVAGTIDGATNYTLTGQYSFVTIISDGSAYWIIAKG